jgi:uncharacterized protein
MDVNSRNLLFSRGEINRDDLWPKITEYRDQPCTFRFSFGLDELPTEAGIILIRGPRQFGKSTWLELAIKRTLETHGAGSAYFLNGDDITDADELETRVLEVVSLFRPKAAVQRLFIDEISAVPNWERALKRIADRGQLRNVLVITTGSKAADIRRGSPNDFPAGKESSRGPSTYSRGCRTRTSTPSSARSWAMIHGKPTC